MEAEGGHSSVEMDVRDAVLQENGVIHGGFLTTLADSAGVYAVLSVTGDITSMASIEFKVNFLAPGLPDNGVVRATGETVKVGGTICLVRVDVHQGDVLVLTGLFTYHRRVRRE